MSMDLTGLITESWHVLRRATPLWGLGLISALQAGFYGLVVVGLILPMSLLTQLLAQQTSAPAGLGSLDARSVQALTLQVIRGVQEWGLALLGLMLVIFALWVVLGVFDVAATAGTISQTSGFVDGREASVGAGLRDGFGIWWRTVGLLAVAALPSLLYLLSIAVFTLFTISIPLHMGRTPDIAAMQSGNAVNGLLSLLVAVVGVPLGVLVQLGLRYAVLEHLEWRPAFSAAWRLAKSRLGEVALVYLVQVGISTGVVFAMSFVIGVVAAAAGIIVALLVGASHGFTGAAVFVTAIALLLVVGVVTAVSAGLFVWASAIWTLFWRGATRRALGPDAHTTPGNWVVSERPQSEPPPTPLAQIPFRSCRNVTPPIE